jgi:hypothetical protein
MTLTQKKYSLASEAFTSFLTGFPLSLIADLLFWLVYMAFDTNLLHHRFFLLLNLNAWDMWKLELARNAGLIPVTFIMFFLVGGIQFLLLCLPFAKWTSQGLQGDAGRGTPYYLAAGALLGGGPWLLLVSILLFHTIESFGEAAFLIFPSLTAGIIAGAVLKLRLIKLAASSGIETTKQL